MSVFNRRLQKNILYKDYLCVKTKLRSLLNFRSCILNSNEVKKKKVVKVSKLLCSDRRPCSRYYLRLGESAARRRFLLYLVPIPILHSDRRQVRTIPIISFTAYDFQRGLLGHTASSCSVLIIVGGRAFQAEIFKIVHVVV